MSIEVIGPLASLLDVADTDHPFVSLSKLITSDPKNTFASFIHMDAEQSKQSKRAKTESQSAPKSLTTRQAYQEMRTMDNITPNATLSDGRQVGEFLLDQWLQKEARK